jgi:beta-lactamase regulating signal transducer with metallopeptidase domain
MGDSIQTAPVVLAIGWALLHFIWQGAVIAAVLGVLLRGLRSTGPTARYAVACAGLAAMATAPIVTFLSAWGAASLRAWDAVPGAAALVASADPGRSGLVASPGVEPLLPIAVSIWMAGVIVLSARLALSCWSIGRLKRTTRAVDEAVATRVRMLSHRLGLRRPVCVLESAVVRVPAVVGSLRPVMLLPASVITGLPATHLDAVIAHELAHLRRLDHLVNAAQAALETVLFYHPAVWWCSRQVRIEREHCCDDVVVEACGDRFAYATALTRLEELRGVTPALVLSAGGGRLIDRVRRLLAPMPGGERRSSAWVIVGGLVTAFALIAAGPALSSRVVALAAGAGREQAAPVPPRVPQAPRPAPVPVVPASPAPPALPVPFAPVPLTPLPADDWADVERQFEAAIEQLTAEYERALREAAPSSDLDRQYIAETQAALERLARETQGIVLFPEPPEPPEPPTPLAPLALPAPMAPPAPGSLPRAPFTPAPLAPLALPAPPAPAPAPPGSLSPQTRSQDPDLERALENLRRAQEQIEAMRSELVKQQERLREHERAVELQRRALAEMEAQIVRSRADSRAATSEQLAQMRKLLEETYKKQIDETREKANLLQEAELMRLRKQLEELNEKLKAK